MQEDILALVWSIAVVCAVLALAYLFTRYVVGRAAGQVKGRKISPIEQIMVGRDQKLMLVQVEDRVYFLGMSPGGITVVDVLPNETVEAWKQEKKVEGTGNTMGFPDALRKVLEQRKQRKGPGEWMH